MMHAKALFTLTLALLVALTSQQLAQARGITTDTFGQVILCTGQGVVTVTLDADGNPVEPAHFCPECALNVMAAIAPQNAEPLQLVHMRDVRQHLADVFLNSVVHRQARARGPPVLV